ncbi:YdeI/OmpD-associated family protein [Paenibacillus radicis (ex Gao et al. 2016)]|uniref:Uncharacterized protein n=1 Tax=Paenibacillus radicis (ex Gao et al. 2016) TaxID=1737354 RepID=A0A917HA00_9BACL|nr:YdeI/OmpD-associated family protein [Paenibacillus radicis (ex Gao et al. 2016)]GGG72491.1 hypothetical protein GCM10010918_30360 [Paenibacillus radicis (ex Gao et al. 2016)]
MVARIPIEEAMMTLKDKKGPGFSYFYKALKKYNIDYLSWRKVESFDELPLLCLLGVEFPTYGHSVLYYDGIFYDPEFGVLESYTPAGEIKHYVELFVDELYKDRQVDIRLPEDFKEAFENDHEAFEIFNSLPYPDKSKLINGISHYKNAAVRKNNITKIMDKIKTM